MKQGQIGTNPTTKKVLPQEESSDGNAGAHKYFTQIPNIIFHIGLKGNQIAVYAAILRSANESGYCYELSKTLADESGVEEKTFRLIKKKLAEPNPILGYPLLRVKNRQLRKLGFSTDEIQITDISSIGGAL